MALFGWAMLLGPLAVLLHELGQWVVGKAAGFQPTLHAYAVSGMPETPPFGGNPTGIAASGLAGPMVTLLLTENDLVRGRASRFSLHALANIATAMGRKVHFELQTA